MKNRVDVRYFDSFSLFYTQDYKINFFLASIKYKINFKASLNKHDITTCSGWLWSYLGRIGTIKIVRAVDTAESNKFYVPRGNIYQINEAKKKKYQLKYSSTFLYICKFWYHMVSRYIGITKNTLASEKLCEPLLKSDRYFVVFSEGKEDFFRIVWAFS